MLGRRDAIFWTAAGIIVVSLVLAGVFSDAFLFLLVAAYLLRPTVHSLGFAKQLVDERQMQIQYRASNVGFVVMVLGSIVVILYLMKQGDDAWQWINMVLLIALAARALTGLLMVGDPALAGPRILIATGLLFCLFGLVEAGISPGALVHGIPGLVIVGMGLASRRYPRVIAGLVFVLAGLLATLVSSRVLRGHDATLPEVVALLFIAVPPVIAAVCLLRANAGEEGASGAGRGPAVG